MGVIVRKHLVVTAAVAVAFGVGILARDLVQPAPAGAERPADPHRTQTQVTSDTEHLGQRLIDRSGTTLQQSYFTLVSILQGVAMSLLIVEAVSFLDLDNDGPVTLDWWRVTRVALLFMVIILVTFQYTWISILDSRLPTLRDTFLPLTLGLFELASIRLLSEEGSFWVALTVFLFCALVAFLSTWQRLKSDGLSEAGPTVRGGMVHLALLCLVAMLVSFGTTVVIIRTSDGHSREMISLTAQLLLMAACVAMILLTSRVRKPLSLAVAAARGSATQQPSIVATSIQ